ncbi:transcriptional regulator [Streptomyces sp. Ag109_G2-15]|uniref:transcriptional regulator n=1 Tax=Streptomyces sp. Ag109_G2-15 TaxID=1938850 RepID=UPI000BCC9273|nr:transcriptional regulator [Streptomyces sp. Ag109_G2-15]SOD88653.1 Thiaminase [Streptomyces sp. Ag109_G2-15]
MTLTAAELLAATTARLAPDPHPNSLVPRIARGEASRETLAALALEQRWVIAADHRSFLHLAERAADSPAATAFFTSLAEGEALAGEHLAAFAEESGVTEERTRSHPPRPGCQAYPAYVAWLALNGSPADVILALTANFSAWGGYCARIAEGLRRHYGFSDEASAFFDFFAQPAPDLDARATAAVQAALDTGRLNTDLAHIYGSLLQSYEAMFWDSLREAP